MIPEIGDITYVTTSDKTADKCKVLEWFLQFPLKIQVESLNTGLRYDVYPEWHCYKTEEEAVQAAQKYQDRYEDLIY